MIDKTFQYGDKFTPIDYNMIIDEMINAIYIIVDHHKSDYLFFSALVDELKTCYARNYFDVMKSENTNKIISIANIISEYEDIGIRITKRFVPGDILDPNIFNQIIEIVNEVQAKWQK